MFVEYALKLVFMVLLTLLLKGKRPAAASPSTPASHPIFDDIYHGRLQRVQRRVLANSTVLEERGLIRAQTPLIYALAVPRCNIAQWMIEHGGQQQDFNTRDVHGFAALHYACNKCPPWFVRALVAGGADPTLPGGEEGKTPLMVASSYGKLDIVANLLRFPAVQRTIDTASNSGDKHYTALYMAMVPGHLDIVQLLLDAGADPTIPVAGTSLHFQAKARGRATIARLLKDATFRGWHPIFGDIHEGNLEAVAHHVRGNSTVLEERRRPGNESRAQTPLIYATFMQQNHVASWIIQHKGSHNLDTKDMEGMAALHYACTLGLLEIVQALVAAGANPTLSTSSGETPLMLACSHGWADIAAGLLWLPSVRAFLDATDSHGHTALSSAVSKGYYGTVETLLMAGAQPTISLLKEAVKKGRTDILHLLSSYQQGTLFTLALKAIKGVGYYVSG